MNGMYYKVGFWWYVINQFICRNCRDHFARNAEPITHIDSVEVKDVLSFVIEGIKRMRSSSFHSHRTGLTPLEDHYQKEFYSALQQVDGLFLSPEFGTAGIKGLGCIDFFLAPNKWGIEFTRNGNKIKEHYSRFLPNGKYHRWICDKTMLDWVLIDFRTQKPSQSHPGKSTLPLMPTRC